MSEKAQKKATAEMNSLGARLSGERHRLGLTQEDLAKIGGVQRRAQARYEANGRFPDAGYLASAAEAGLDVLYVITGRRAPPVNINLLCDAVAAIGGWQQKQQISLTPSQLAQGAVMLYAVSEATGTVAEDAVEVFARLATRTQ